MKFIGDPSLLSGICGGKESKFSNLSTASIGGFPMVKGIFLSGSSPLLGGLCLSFITALLQHIHSGSTFLPCFLSYNGCCFFIFFIVSSPSLFFCSLNPQPEDPWTFSSLKKPESCARDPCR